MEMPCVCSKPGVAATLSPSEATTEDAQTELPPARSYFSKELEAIKLFREPRQEEITQRWTFLGTKRKRNLLVLDLDDTLVHTVEVAVDETKKRGSQCVIRLRPHAVKVIEQLSELYELVIFTAGDQEYGQEAAQLLDPDGTHILSVLGREHCIQIAPGVWVKDLRIFADRDVEEILIADNNIISFAFQLANGIPIIPYDPDNAEDEELLNLLQYLEGLVHEQNVVQANKDTIGLTD
jgi:Dullard-like phosphatase family protein